MKKFILNLILIQAIFGILYLVSLYGKRQDGNEVIIVLDCVGSFVFVLVHIQWHAWFKRCPFCGKRTVEETGNGENSGWFDREPYSWTSYECTSCGKTFRNITQGGETKMYETH